MFTLLSLFLTHAFATTGPRVCEALIDGRLTPQTTIVARNAAAAFAVKYAERVVVGVTTEVKDVRAVTPNVWQADVEVRVELQPGGLFRRKTLLLHGAVGEEPLVYEVDPAEDGQAKSSPEFLANLALRKHIKDLTPGREILDVQLSPKGAGFDAIVTFDFGNGQQKIEGFEITPDAGGTWHARATWAQG